MKIAIITLFGFSNYGNRLQNYALQEAIKKLGFEVTSLAANSRKELVKSTIRSYINRKEGKISLVPRTERLRERSIKTFSDRLVDTQYIIRRNRKFDNSLEDQYDCFIVGSDQVWNPLFWEKEGFSRSANNYFLQFVKGKKKIAYAASFGIPEIPNKYHTLFRDSLSCFDTITLREDVGAKIVKELTGRDSNVVLDPTMLLGPDDWRDVETGIVNSKDKYVVLYFLGNQPSHVYEEIQQYAKENNAKVIDLMDERNPEIYTKGPEAFIEYIDKAMACFTDSFHATVFSILFHTPFITYARTHANNSNMNSRIETLLSKLCLLSRIYSGSASFKDMHYDYSEADRRLIIERDHSLHALQAALCGD